MCRRFLIAILIVVCSVSCIQGQILPNSTSYSPAVQGYPGVLVGMSNSSIFMFNSPSGYRYDLLPNGTWNYYASLISAPIDPQSALSTSVFFSLSTDTYGKDLIAVTLPVPASLVLFDSDWTQLQSLDTSGICGTDFYGAFAVDLSGNRIVMTCAVSGDDPLYVYLYEVSTAYVLSLVDSFALSMFPTFNDLYYEAIDLSFDGLFVTVAPLYQKGIITSVTSIVLSVDSQTGKFPATGVTNLTHNGTGMMLLSPQGASAQILIGYRDCSMQVYAYSPVSSQWSLVQELQLFQTAVTDDVCLQVLTDVSENIAVVASPQWGASQYRYANGVWTENAFISFLEYPNDPQFASDVVTGGEYWAIQGLNTLYEFSLTCSTGYVFVNNTCFPCPAGKSSTVFGATSFDSCALCPPGTTSSAGAIDCYPCPLGTYGKPDDSTHAFWTCHSCAPKVGLTTGAVGRFSCVDCPAGLFPNSDYSACIPCPAGQYSQKRAVLDYNVSPCHTCPPGTYNPNPGASDASACRICAAGTYSSPDFSTCLLCPFGTVSSAGTWNISTCTSCPPSDYCPEGSSSPLESGHNETLSEMTTDLDTLAKLPALQQESMLQVFIFVGFGGGGTAAAVVIVSVYFFRNGRKWIHRGMASLDMFKLKHNTDLGDPVISRSTYMGGVLTLLMVVAVLGLLVILGLQVLLFNTGFSISLRPGASDSIMEAGDESNIVAKVAFVGYGGACDLESVSVSYSGFLSPTTSVAVRFDNETGVNKCYVSWECSKCHLTSQGLLGITISENFAYASTIVYNVSGSSVFHVDYDGILYAGNFVAGQIVPLDIGKSFCGSSPSVVSIMAYPAIFQKNNKDEGSGYQLYTRITDVGDACNATQYTVQNTVGIQFVVDVFDGYAAIQVNPTISLQLFLTSLASLGGTIMTAFGVLLGILEGVQAYRQKKMLEDQKKRASQYAIPMDTLEQQLLEADRKMEQQEQGPL